MAAQYPFNQSPAPTSILAQTFEGVPGGMNMSLPAHEIDDSQAVMILDFLVDKPGITRQRGPVQGIATTPALPRHGVGLVSTLDPQGTPRYAALTGDAGSGKFTVLSADGTTWTDLTWPFNLPSAAGTFYLVDAKPALGGGLLIGVTSDFNAGTSVVQGLAYWFGANKVNYTNTVTGTRGSKTVTGTSFLTNLVPGMFLFANTDDPYTSAYIGCVQSVDSDTSLTLAAKSPYTFTAKSGTFQAIRGIVPKVTVGEITTSTSSTTVTGGATKFLSQGLNSGTWQVYRASDFAFVGKVSSVTNDGSLTLAAPAAVSMASEPYIAIQVDGNFAINSLDSGVFNASYANRQWYANRATTFDTTSQVWFSDEGDLEALDLSTWDGNWFKVASAEATNEPIRGLGAAYNGLLVFKETETYIINGNSPDSFTVSKLEDDGTICGMSIQGYGGGVIWAGREGINFYDGVQTSNLVGETLGQVWKDTIRTLDPTKYRIWSMVNRDHYFLNLENVSPDFTVTKANTSSSFTTLTIVINMVTRAVTFATNLNLRGSTIVPASDGRHAWYLVNGKIGAGSSLGYVCDGDNLFTKTGADSIVCDGAVAGPSFYLESKKFNAGDSMRLKRWKMVAMNYLAEGGDIILDIVLGLNDVGQVASTTFPQSVPTWSQIAENVPTWTDMKNQYSTWASVIQSVFIPARIRMQKKSQFMSFRLYGSTSPMANVELGPYEVVFKQQRVGRV